MTTTINESEYVFLGYFTQKTTDMLVSDPGFIFDKNTYLDGIWNLHIWIKNVRQGEWNSWIIFDNDTEKNIALIACLTKNNNSNEYNSDEHEWKKHGEFVPVDSGQAGIYDLKYYRDNQNTGIHKIIDFVNKNEEGEKWYGMNCHITMNNSENAGVIPNGVVSESGYGDGMYDLYIEKSNSGDVIGVKIQFITEENKKMYESIMVRESDDDST